MADGEMEGRAEPQSAERPERSQIDLGPLPGLIGYGLRRAQLAVFQDFIQSFAAFDIRPAQYSVLVILDANPGRKQSEIAAALGIKRSNFVALIAGLEQLGLARRELSMSDRRSHALFITETGSKLLAELHEIRANHENRLLALIGPSSRQELLELLERLTLIAPGFEE